MEKGEISTNVDEINSVPPKGKAGKILSWIIPSIIVLLVILGIVLNGWDQGLRTFGLWALANCTGTFIFTLLGGGTLLNSLLSAITAPFFALNPVLGVGMFAGVMQATLKKPQVKDFESLNDDASKLKGWYKNRLLRCLLVFLTSSIGSILGSLVAFPILIARL